MLKVKITSAIVILTLLAMSWAFLAIWYAGVIMAGKLPLPFCCSYPSV